VSNNRSRKQCHVESVSLTMTPHHSKWRGTENLCWLFNYAIKILVLKIRESKVRKVKNRRSKLHLSLSYILYKKYNNKQSMIEKKIKSEEI